MTRHIHYYSHISYSKKKEVWDLSIKHFKREFKFVSRNNEDYIDYYEFLDPVYKHTLTAERTLRGIRYTYFY